MSKWTKIAVESNRTLWKHANGTYQITLSSIPFGDIGYYNVEWLVNARGLPLQTFSYFYHGEKQ